LTSGGWPELNAFDGVVKREIQQQKTLQWLMFIFGVHWRSYKDIETHGPLERHRWQ
jgi:hypothetical protein